MNIFLSFIKKAIDDKNYVSFTYENKLYKSVKPLKLSNENLLHTNKGVFEFSKIKNLTVLKDRF
ncbi:hypothetical protein [Arcobacter roscoffensis]|uniref:HipA N-terminal subdomain 1 domain-containing protein n=1 Tax=Arcobacter roscoffensis TaxID=2961520 RepID=A0ABY5E2S2_9BACT|nr:hypothetical protein [Arcobacter roscoffensis]UTJ06482.1 hypothetical protein NJU99_14750 [Arcobacter roscoffensis]